MGMWERIRKDIELDDCNVPHKLKLKS